MVSEVSLIGLASFAFLESFLSRGCVGVGLWGSGRVLQRECLNLEVPLTGSEIFFSVSGSNVEADYRLQSVISVQLEQSCVHRKSRAGTQ